MTDLSHIDKQIKLNQVNINEARNQAVAQRTLAVQKQQGEDTGAPEYYEQQARHYDEKADQLAEENERLNDERQRTQQRITELEDEKARTEQEHAEKVRQIDSELTQLRGSGLLL